MPVLIAPAAPPQPKPAIKPPRSVWASLLSWRKRPGFGKIEAGVLAAYCILLACVIPFHEPWGDEAQAWLVARDNTVWQIIRYRLHYEGAPALWHLLLHVFQILGGRYGALDWFGALFAVAGVAVMLRWSPFPLIIRALLPFTFFFAYQYAVVARSYVLFGLLVFGLCALYGRRRKIVWYGVVAALLTNLSVQGFIFAWLVSLGYLWDMYQDRGIAPIPWRSIRNAALVLLPATALACYSALPAPDVDFIGAASTSQGLIHSASERFIGYSPGLFATLPPPDPWQPPQPELPKPQFKTAPRQWVAWYINHRRVLNARGDVAQETFFQHRLEDFFSVISQATAPLSTSNVIACGFLCLLAIWLWKARCLWCIVPWCVLLVVGQILWFTDHHMGMLMSVLVGVAWLGYKRNPSARRPMWLEYSFIGAFVLVLVGQIAWTAISVHEDIEGHYDPGKETAQFMLEHPVARTAAFHFWSVSVVPYFKQNPFYNMGSRYWPWAWLSEPDPYYRTVVADHPDRIVYSIEVSGPGQMRNQWIPIGKVTGAQNARTLPWDYMFKYLHAHGYVETHRFCGTRFSRASFSHRACDIILEPSGPDPLQKDNAKYANPDDSE